MFLNLIGIFLLNTQWQKIFDEEVKKLVRDILTEKNGTTDNDLSSIENVILRVLKNPTKAEIEIWINERDWSLYNFPQGEEKGRKGVSQALLYILDEIRLPDKIKEKLNNIIITVASKDDYIAEFFWAKLNADYHIDDELAKDL
jgi:hypothetical protein